MVKETYLINEAAKEVHVESHVLRYWEEELDLPIKRNEQGHRIYTQEDIDRFLKIKNLKDKGLQLKAVKSVLSSDNPFAQKQLTKLSKTVQDNVPEEPKKNMIEIKSIKSLMKQKNEVSQTQNVSMSAEEQTQRLQYLFQKLIKDAVEANNEELSERLVARISESVRDDVCKELDYQFRLLEERGEERESSRISEENKRNEEYYRRIDELLCQHRDKTKFTRMEKKGKKEKEKKDEKTIRFPLTGKEKETKPKKEFHLFKKTPEAKYQ